VFIKWTDPNERETIKQDFFYSRTVRRDLVQPRLLKTSRSDLRADDPPHGGDAVCPAFGGYSQEDGPTAGAADAQMSSRYRWLVTRPVSHALPSAAEAPVRRQKRSTKACLTSGAMREASPHTNTSASFCKSYGPIMFPPRRALRSCGSAAEKTNCLPL
jgi:hypothetical protein